MTEKEFLTKEFNSFMGIEITGKMDNKHIDRKVEIIQKYLSKLGLKEGKVIIDNLTLEERDTLRTTLIKYVEILDREHKNKDDAFRFVQYIKNLLVIDKKLNS